MFARSDFFGRPLRGSEIGMRGEIARKWSKITSQEIAALQSNDGLITLVQTKYQLARQAAHDEVEAFAKGRRL